MTDQDVLSRFAGGPSCPGPAAAALLADFVNTLYAALAEDLAAVYIHGSLALGGYIDGESDVDAAVIVRRPLPLPRRVALAGAVAALCRRHRETELEFTVLRSCDAARPVHPVPFEFHCSTMWLDSLERDPAAHCRLGLRDPDLIAQLAVARQSGVALYGPPPACLIGPVARDDLLASLWADIAGAQEDIIEDPLYGVTNLCRTLAWLEDGVLRSKKDGAAWAAAHVDWAQGAARWAISHWTGGGTAPPAQEALQAFAGAALLRIRPHLPG